MWRFLTGIRRATLLLGMLPVIAAANTGLNQVTAARFWTHPASTRVIIDVSGSFEFRSDRATNPDRLFFDILGSRPWIDGKRIAVKQIGDALVKRLRIAETAPGTTRIVFDLETNAEFTVTKMDTPDRLVVELRPALSFSTQNRLATTSSLTGSSNARLRNFRLAFVAPPPREWTRPQILPAPLTPIWQASISPVRAFFLPDPLRSMVIAPPKRTSRNIQVAQSTPTGVPTGFTSRPAIVPYSAPPAGSAPATPFGGETATSKTATSKTTTLVLPAPSEVPTSGPAISLKSPVRASSGSAASMTRALGLKINRVVIDAGHGGHDFGTIGPNGVNEKEVVLDVALRVAKLIQERLGAEVVLTRSDDTFIPLQERTAIANRHKADLFLSIHANSSPASQVAGTETFFLNFSNSPAVLDVAARENAGSDKSVGELKDLIQSITLNDKVQESRVFAEEVQRSISVNAAKNNPTAKDRGIKRAPFIVLIGASMPSVLAEIGFLSNSRDEKNLSRPDYRQKVAEALFKGVSQYSLSLSHFEVTKTDKAEKRVAGLN